MATTEFTTSRIEELLGDDARLLLDHRSETFDKANLHLPGPDFIDRVFLDSDRPTNVLRQLQWLIHSGRLSGTGHVSILPIDQGIEHAGGASFAPNPIYFDPENLVKLAVDGGCNAIASTLGVLVGGVKRLRPAGGSLALVCTDDNITKIFEITGLDRVFPIHSSRDDALAAVASSG